MDAPDGLDPRVAGIVAGTIGIDTHNHVDVPQSAADTAGSNMDLLGEIKRSRLAAVCMTFTTDYQPGDAYERFLKDFAATDELLKQSRMKRALTPEDISAAHRSGQPAVIQAVEGGHFLQGHIERAKEAYDRGLRVFGLLHDSDATPPLGDVYTKPPRFSGLTAFGVRVVKECNRLGMLMDLTHGSMAATEGAVKASSRPILYSHTGLDTRPGSDAKMAEMMRPRLISKEHARLIAGGGGLVGLWTHLAATPLEYAQNIRAMVDVVGVDHVCLGTDTKLTPAVHRAGAPPPPPPPHVGERTNEAWAGEKTGFYYVVVDAMLKTGFTAAEIGKIGGGNFLRVFSEAVTS